MQQVPVRDVYALVDDDDFEFVSQFKWYKHKVYRHGELRYVYAYRSVPKEGGGYTTQYMHTLLTGWNRVDHIDHNGLNNCRSNLRPVTRSQNAQNSIIRDARKVSQYKGVGWHKAKSKWRMRIQVDGRRVEKHFDSEIEAARAYDELARQYFGEYAQLNFG